MVMDSSSGAASAAGAASSGIASLIDEGSVESHRYFLARRTLFEMLRDRGYAVPSSDIEMTLADFRATKGNNPDPASLEFSASLLSDTSKQILVMFCGPESVKLSTITAISNKIDKEAWTRMILVVQSSLTSQARQATKDRFPFKVEIFQLRRSRLLVRGRGSSQIGGADCPTSPLKHWFALKLVPIYRLFTGEFLVSNMTSTSKIPFEVYHDVSYSLEIFFGLSFPPCVSQLPRMLETDALARYYGLGKGQIVKITHDAEATGHHVTYRCVL